MSARRAARVLRSGGRRAQDRRDQQPVHRALFERDGRSALLTGDAGAPAETRAARGRRRSPAVDVLKVGHHGSRTSTTTAAFWPRLRPRVALLSCGRRNRFGHPAPETLADPRAACVPGRADGRAVGRARGAAARGDAPGVARAWRSRERRTRRPISARPVRRNGRGQNRRSRTRWRGAAGGEIVSADAFAVYRGFDVGTAKPSAAIRARRCAYHLVDVAEPEETYSAGRWASEARVAVEDMVRRGKLPIVCGGSGFYIAALLDGLPPGETRDEALREALFGWAERARSRRGAPVPRRQRSARGGADPGREPPVHAARARNPAR